MPIGTAVINEVLFDPVGVAGSDGSWQWVEVYAKARCNLGGWQLRNAADQPMVETLSESSVVTVDGLGMVTTGTITALQQSIDDLLIRALQPGAVGSLTASSTPTAAGTDYSYDWQCPLLQFGTPTTVSGQLRGSVTTGNGKEIQTGTIELRSDGVVRQSMSFVVDPPLSQGAAEKTFGDKLKDAAWTTVTCAAGGFAAQVTVEGTAGKRALIRMLGKAAAKKALPCVGWASTAICFGKAVWDWCPARTPDPPSG